MFSLFRGKLRTFDFKSSVHKTVGDRHLLSAGRTGWSRKDMGGEVWRVKLSERSGSLTVGSIDITQ